MCRIAAYSGPAIALEEIIVKPTHSLLSQSQHANEAKLAVNGDGFGIAWYGAGSKPGLYRDVLPAWADDNLVNLCRMVHSHRFVAHIRASTMGETARANCHPFSWKNWAFCHNGQVPHFPRIRRKLEAALPDDLYNHRRGTTDSEMIFLTLLRHGLMENPQSALLRTIAELSPAPTDAPLRMTTVFSDGETLFGLRHASDNHSPTLYVSDLQSDGGRILASEPLCGNPGNWQLVPPETLCSVSPNGTVSYGALDETARLSA